MSQDEEQLNLLSIFHYVIGVLTGLFATVPILHLTFGLVLVFAPDLFPPQERPPAFLGWIVVIFAAIVIGIGWTFAGSILAAGRFLSQRKHYTFCFVVAAVECIFTPFGTVLGVFTILVLSRESVKTLFAASDDLPAEAAAPEF